MAWWVQGPAGRSVWLEGVHKEEESEVMRALGGSSHALKAPGGIYDKDREVLRGSGEHNVISHRFVAGSLCLTSGKQTRSDIRARQEKCLGVSTTGQGRDDDGLDKKGQLENTGLKVGGTRQK